MYHALMQFDAPCPQATEFCFMLWWCTTRKMLLSLTLAPSNCSSCCICFHSDIWLVHVTRCSIILLYGMAMQNLCQKARKKKIRGLILIRYCIKKKDTHPLLVIKFTMIFPILHINTLKLLVSLSNHNFK